MAPTLPLLALLGACGHGGTCPEGMVLAPGPDGSLCISRYEMSSDPPMAPGVDLPPQVRIVSREGNLPLLVTWEQARRLCGEALLPDGSTQAGWHLCTSREWRDACDGTPGDGGRPYPTPTGGYTDKTCGVASYKVRFSPALSPTGAYPDCHTPEGVYDLLGNAWEWTDPQVQGEDGQPVTDKRGAAHYSGSPATCAFDALGQHPPSFRGTTGFRCCVAAGP